MATEQRRRFGWARGLTAATDPRIAKMAASRAGQRSWARGLTAADHPSIARQAEARRGKTRGPYRWTAGSPSGRIDFGPEDLVGSLRAHYAYLLGLYLGDGTVYAFPSSRLPRSAKLDIFLDRRYPSVVESAATAMRAIHPRGRVAISGRKQGCTVVRSCGKFWLRLIPQHGPGRKHTRKIALVDWQEKIVLEYPWEFFRGLIDSDGCRYDRVVSGRAYPAYEFKNRSIDIIRIFCRTADLLRLHYTIPAFDSVSIATRAAVAVLDAKFPPKASAGGEVREPPE